MFASIFFAKKVCHFLDKTDCAVFSNLFKRFSCVNYTTFAKFLEKSPNCQLTQNWKKTIRQFLKAVFLKYLFVNKLLIISVWRRVQSIVRVKYQVDFIENMIDRFLYEIL